MDGTIIRLSRRLFGDDVALRTAHRYTHFFHVSFQDNPDEIEVVLTPRDGVEVPADLALRFHSDALDERLREIVRLETRDIHAELIRTALREATHRGEAAAP